MAFQRLAAGVRVAFAEHWSPNVAALEVGSLRECVRVFVCLVCVVACV